MSEDGYEDTGLARYYERPLYKIEHPLSGLSHGLGSNEKFVLSAWALNSQERVVQSEIAAKRYEHWCGLQKFKLETKKEVELAKWNVVGSIAMAAVQKNELSDFSEMTIKCSSLNLGFYSSQTFRIKFRR